MRLVQMIHLSSLISLTSDPDVARVFAGKNGIVREFRMPKSMVVKNPHNRLTIFVPDKGIYALENEWLARNVIHPNFIKKVHK